MLSLPVRGCGTEMPRIVNKEAKRDELIQAAATVFARSGFLRTKMAHIAEEAGVGKGTLYEYFPSKDDLFLAVCINLVDWPSADSFPPSSGDALRQLIFALVESYERASGFFSILIDYWSVIVREHGEHGQTFLAQGASLYERPRELVCEVLRTGQRRGDVRGDLDVVRIAQIILAGIEGLRLQRALDAEHLDLHQAVSTFADMIAREIAES
jgi:AcrR family transcriptional regulator